MLKLYTLKWYKNNFRALLFRKLLAKKQTKPPQFSLILKLKFEGGKKEILFLYIKEKHRLFTLDGGGGGDPRGNCPFTNPLMILNLKLFYEDFLCQLFERAIIIRKIQIERLNSVRFLLGGSITMDKQFSESNSCICL